MNVFPYSHRRVSLAAKIVFVFLSSSFANQSCWLHAAVPLGYQLSWSDEFEYSQLNKSDWWYRADEKQQSIQLPSNVELDNGELVLNLTPLAMPINGFGAAGAGVITQQRFHYGYYETRSKLGDGIDHDNDGKIDEGWHHAFWAMAAEADPNGNVLTTFPSFRRTEIDGYENGSSGNIGRMSQHVLVWNDQGQITHKLPSSDITFNTPGTEYDWHTYGFEWTPREVRFYVDGQLTKTAAYPVEQFEHDQINLWLTAISTNAEANSGPGQELSEARYDYFRFYEKGAINVANGEILTAGVLDDIPGAARQGTGGVAGDITVEGGGLLNGAGWVYGNVAVQAGGVVRVGDAASQSVTPTSVTTTEDFESFTPGTAFASGSSTGLMPNWTFFDLADPGESTTDSVWQISGADGTGSEPSDSALTGESQMLFQTNTDIDFSLDPQGSPFAGAIAVTDALDTSGNADIINADIVFDGYGDPSNQNLDTKLVFGFRDVDNWLALSLVRGSSSSPGATQIQVSANVDGDRQTVFSTGGTAEFPGYFEQDTILHAQLQHDATLGYVSFEIVDPNTGTVLAEASGLDDRFKFDGDLGLAVNNDATGIDNISVTTRSSLPLEILQDLEILGDTTFAAGSTLELDLASTTVHDQLLSTGSVALGGTLEASLAPQANLALGDVLTIVDAAGGVSGHFDDIFFPELAGDLSFIIRYLPNSVEIEVVQGFDSDFNYDGTVDDADFARWQDKYGGSSGADANDDGQVDGLDFLVWQTEYGSSVSGVATTSAAVPEASAELLGLTCLLLICGSKTGGRRLFACPN